MGEFREGRGVVSFTYANDVTSTAQTFEDAVIVMEPGNGGLVPWIRHSFHGDMVLVNCAYVDSVRLQVIPAP
jgi:hypothetical protein